MNLALTAGINLLSENNALAGVLLNAIFLLGTFSFAVILGVVSDDISSEVKVGTAGDSMHFGGESIVRSVSNGLDHPAVWHTRAQLPLMFQPSSYLGSRIVVPA